MTFDLNCNASENVCSGVRTTLKAATEIISSVFQFESSLIVNATYSSFRLSSNTHHPENAMAAIGQSFPTISYIMTDKSDNMTRMYPQALLKQFTNLPVKPNWAHYDINAQFNSDVNWYFINDPHSIEDDQIDFLRNVIHELIHGLGFMSSWSDNLYKSFAPLVDDLNHFITPMLLSAINQNPVFSNYASPFPFWGFLEFPFDKLIHTSDMQPLSAITTQLNKFYNSNIVFQSALDLGNAWYSSDAYRAAADLYQKTVTAKDLMIAIDDQQVLWLESSLKPFNSGSSLSHVDSSYYINTTEYLMVYMANRGVSLSQLAKTFPSSPLGPKLLQAMAALGYRIKGHQMAQPRLEYWNPPNGLAGSSSNPSPSLVKVTGGPAHSPSTSTVSTTTASSSYKFSPSLVSYTITISFLTLLSVL
ncbi:hypothetical protein G6F37_009510 [Rhizopus arrhizus]|nr:hypothetical protein G6F38_009618 [Rhizopus arrhizus]KAG1154374.1 hypothetical protein G6F37_009510 [Rhizopus arrhizus]